MQHGRETSPQPTEEEITRLAWSLFRERMRREESPDPSVSELERSIQNAEAWERKRRARRAKRLVFAGKCNKTSGGLARGDLVKNKHGIVVYKKLSEKAKKSPWIAACNAARTALCITGFVAIKKTSPLYKKAKQLYKNK